MQMNDTAMAQDLARLYLRRVSDTPPLTREEEVAIAKRLEAARHELRHVLMAHPITQKIAEDIVEQQREAAPTAAVPHVKVANIDAAPAAAPDAETTRDDPCLEQHIDAIMQAIQIRLRRHERGAVRFRLSNA